MFELRVMTGLHRGAALPLVGEQWLIGADDELDLALHDPGVAPQHCKLQREGETWTLSAQDGTVTDSEGHAHTATPLQPNHPFVLGSVWLALCEADEPWPALPALTTDAAAQTSPPTEGDCAALHAPLRSRLSFFNRITWVILGALFGVVGSAWSLSHHAATGETPIAKSVEPPTAPAVSVITAANAQRPTLSANDAAQKLRTMLSERLLTDITVEQTPRGLVLRGNLQSESRLVFKRMLQRFDEYYKGSVAVIDDVGSGSSSSLPFAIVQIMSGPQAHLVTANGKRLYIGDELNGLRLTRIEDGRVEFEGDRHYEVSW
ncbi:FHA domain-containing protein [Pseudomonas sp. GL-B-16]|uniref:FHA domain-containing protein n=1 Tax=Pseudomonas sp. GL-B-16 TaxID=2832373 RepID=UPI001CC0243D|nr:FHA domain-containing protein [Pseudomonas sp. GL-B-16]